MKKTVIINILLLLVSVSGLKAQDTIDTNYCFNRYGNSFNEYGILQDVQTIGNWHNACPNGLGFGVYGYWKFDSQFRYSLDDFINDDGSYEAYDEFLPFTRSNGYVQPDFYPTSDDIYMEYRMGGGRKSVYGIAFAIDSVFNLTEGDSMTAIMYILSEDSSQFIALDSITIKGGEMGKRRWIEIPMLKSELAENGVDENTEPLEDCIDSVLYRQVIELYFDRRSHTITDECIYWRLRITDSNGSIFYGSYVTHPCGFIPFAGIENGVAVQQALSPNGWDFLFPILSPLPDWEVPTITQVVPDAQKPDNPDPQNPDDPQDPDNPGGDEGIGEAIGSQQSSVTIYPNPASNSAVVTCAQPILELTLRDINGRLIITLRNCGTSTTLDTSTLSPGLYTLQVTTPAATTTRKLAVRP